MPTVCRRESSAAVSGRVSGPLNTAGSGRSAHWKRVAALFMVIGIASLAGCTVLDSTLPARGTAVNIGSANTREDGILLNIVRASRSEPLNFMTLSKYNAAGTLEGSIGMTHNGKSLNYDVVNNPAVQSGARTISNAFVANVLTPSVRSNTAMNFDLAPLENQEFYTQFMSSLGIDRLNLLVNAGIARELVLHSIVKSARMVHRDGREFEYANDPSDDRWNGEAGEAARRQCEELQEQGAFRLPFTTRLWDKPHINDCKYQKFLYFLRNAIQYGMTTEIADAPRAPAAAQTTLAKAQTVEPGDDGQPRPQIVTVVLQPAAPSVEPKKRVQICFDRAIAQAYNRTVDASIACGSKSYGRGLGNYSGLGPHVRLISPELRSPYAIFQYFGKMLSAKTIDRVVLFDKPPMLATGDRRILTVTHEGKDCFAMAHHHGEVYCVPNEGATNTKEIFTLLNVLVNLSLKASSLPTTPSIQVAPGG